MQHNSAQLIVEQDDLKIIWNFSQKGLDDKVTIIPFKHIERVEFIFNEHKKVKNKFVGVLLVSIMTLLSFLLGVFDVGSEEEVEIKISYEGGKILSITNSYASIKHAKMIEKEIMSCWLSKTE